MHMLLNRFHFQATQVNFVSPHVTISIRDNNVNGITSDGKGSVYFSPMSSRSLFQLDAQALKNQVKFFLAIVNCPYLLHRCSGCLSFQQVASSPEELEKRIIEYKGGSIQFIVDQLLYNFFCFKTSHPRVTVWQPMRTASCTSPRLPTIGQVSCT